MRLFPILVGDKALKQEIEDLQRKIRALELENELLALVNERHRRQLIRDNSLLPSTPPDK